MAKPVVVKRYKSDKEYQKDATKMIGQGYEVANTVSEDQRSGCMRWLMIGPLALIFKPKAKHVITYRLKEN